MQPDLPNPDSIEALTQTCSICISGISFPYIKLTCNHFFCFECIQQWCKRYNTCPLCQISIGLAYKVSAKDQISEVFFEKTKVEQGLSLDCLDHSYFKEEISKLLRVFYEFEVSRFKQRNSKGTAEEWKFFSVLKKRVEVLRRENEAFARFDPQGLLGEVEGIRDQFEMLKNGEFLEVGLEVDQEYSEDSEDYYDD